MKTALSTIGVIVKINDAAIWGATDYSDIGGAPSLIDATKLTDSVQVNIPGIQEQDIWEVTYQYDTGETGTSDYDRLKALQTAKTKNVPVEVDFPDGSKFTNTGEVRTYIQGKGVGDVITAVAAVTLDGEWTHTPATGE